MYDMKHLTKLGRFKDLSPEVWKVHATKLY